MTAYERVGHLGGAAQLTLASDITTGSSTITATDASTWALISANGPYYFKITDGTTGSVEKCQATGISGNNLTGVSRGVDGSTAIAFTAGAKIDHILSAQEADEANKLVAAILGIASLTAGDLLYLTSSTAFARLAKGTARQALIMNSAATAPSWGDSLASLLTTQADIPYASAANTPARLAKGTALQVLRMNAGATAPEWADSSTFTTVTNVLSGDVTMTSANTFYDGPTVSLTAGTWLLMGSVQVSTSAAFDATAKLWDKSSSVVAAGQISPATSEYSPIPVMGKVTVGSTTSYYISVAATGTGGTIRAAPGANSPGNFASHLTALKVA